MQTAVTGPVANAKMTGVGPAATPALRVDVEAGAVAIAARRLGVPVRAATVGLVVSAPPVLVSLRSAVSRKPDPGVRQRVDHAVGPFPGAAVDRILALTAVPKVAVLASPATDLAALSTANHGPATTLVVHVAVRLSDPAAAAGVDPVEAAHGGGVGHEGVAGCDRIGVGFAGEGDADGVGGSRGGRRGVQADSGAVGDGDAGPVFERVAGRRGPLRRCARLLWRADPVRGPGRPGALEMLDAGVRIAGAVQLHAAAVAGGVLDVRDARGGGRGRRDLRRGRVDPVLERGEPQRHVLLDRGDGGLDRRDGGVLGRAPGVHDGEGGMHRLNRGHGSRDVGGEARHLIPHFVQVKALPGGAVEGEVSSWRRQRSGDANNGHAARSSARVNRSSRCMRWAHSLCNS